MTVRTPLLQKAPTAASPAAPDTGGPAKFTLEEIYGNLGPKEGVLSPTEISRVSVDELMMELLLGTKGEFFDWSGICQKLKDHLMPPPGSDKSPPPPAGAETIKFHLHGISNSVTSNSGHLPVTNSTDDYWLCSTVAGGEDKLTSPPDFGKLFATAGFPTGANDAKVCVITTNHPYITPAKRKTKEIGRFLNYTPGIVASQMQPFLILEFETTRIGATSGFTSTPSQLRFLMGSVNRENTLKTNPNEGVFDSTNTTKIKVIEDSGASVDKDLSKAYTGMEMFLSPQTLTNMDTLDSPTRTSRVKPFLPFASIEAFDVTIANAGAGAMGHKKASLRLKIHDKARLSEISEFIKGPIGFREVLVHTTYGWLAPQGFNLTSEYAKFINENMVTRDMWNVVNTSFTFNETGVAGLSIDLVSSSKKTYTTFKLSQLGEAQKALDDFAKAAEHVKSFLAELSEKKKFVLPTGFSQVLAGMTTGNLQDFKSSEVTAVSQGVLSAVKRVADLASDDFKRFEEALSKLEKVAPPPGSKKAAVPYTISVNETLSTAISDKFEKLARTPDPFLADSSRSEDYFASDLNAYIKNFYKVFSADRTAVLFKDKANAKALREAGWLPDKYNTNASKVMSFGKIFTSFVGTAFCNMSNCDEVQIVFYSMNGECGPMSYHSVAEFPIDVEKLAFDYGRLCREKGTTDLNVEEFIKLVITTQFANPMSIGYGRFASFEPVDPLKGGDPQLKKTKVGKDETTTVAENHLLDWSLNYGDLRIPIIEYSIESGYSSSAMPSLADDLHRGVLDRIKSESEKKQGPEKLIRRIHVFDKTYSPYDLLDKVFDAGSNKIGLGELNQAKVRSKASAYVNSTYRQKALKPRPSAVDLMTLGQALHEVAKQTATQITGSNGNAKITKVYGEKSMTDPSHNPFVTTPGGNLITFEKNADNVKAYLMRFVPTIMPGTNGSLVLTMSAASKTDGTQGAANLARAIQGQKSGEISTTPNGLLDKSEMPIRVSPVQVTMSTKGLPVAQLYQQYFIDLGTGTQLDNIYTLSQIQHSMGPGKFGTNLTFIMTSGYAKFIAPQNIRALMEATLVSEIEAASAAYSSEGLQKVQLNPKLVAQAARDAGPLAEKLILR